MCTYSLLSKKSQHFRQGMPHLLGLELDAAFVFVCFLAEDGDVDLVGRLVMVDSAIRLFFYGLEGTLSDPGPVSYSREALTADGSFLGTKTCRPFLHPSILRNSSNSRTRRLQHR